MMRMRARTFLVIGVMTTSALGAGEARAQVGDSTYCHNYAESVSKGTGGAGRGAARGAIGGAATGAIVGGILGGGGGAGRGAAAGAIGGGAAGGIRRSGSKKRAYQAAYNNCMRGE